MFRFSRQASALRCSAQQDSQIMDPRLPGKDSGNGWNLSYCLPCATIGSQRTRKRSVAWARTMTALWQLEGERKGLLLRFLHESVLIKGEATVDLSATDLIAADPRRADLHGAKLIPEQLAKVKTLRGAILPDRTKYTVPTPVQEEAAKVEPAPEEPEAKDA
jgi:hypothetical protein